MPLVPHFKCMEECISLISITPRLGHLLELYWPHLTTLSCRYSDGTHILRKFTQYTTYKLLYIPINLNLAPQKCLYNHLKQLCASQISILFEVDNLYTLWWSKRRNVACHVITSKMDVAYLNLVEYQNPHVLSRIPRGHVTVNIFSIPNCKYWHIDSILLSYLRAYILQHYSTLYTFWQHLLLGCQPQV